MLKFIGKRLLLMIPILLGISLITLLLLDLTPGEPERLVLGAGSIATPEQVAAVREQLGLNDPFFVRYVRFLGNALKGDFGNSFATSRSVADELFQRFPYTLLIATMSVALSVIIGIPLGIYAATHQYTWKDNAAIVLSLICVSMPGFWFALLLIRFFAVQLHWLPPAGIDNWKGWILPIVSLALGYTATVARQMRSSFLEVIRQDYITTARSKGQTEGKVLYRHALKNALIVVVMTIGSMFGTALGGSLISEIIFSVPGIGQFLFTGLSNRDYPVIQGCVLFISVVFSFVILLVDVIFAFIDPRIRSQFSKKQ